MQDTYLPMQSEPTYEQLVKRRFELKARLAEHKKIEEKLKESHALYQSLFDHAGVGIVLTDLHTGKVTAFNKKAHEDLQYTAEEFKTKNYKDFIGSEKNEYEKKTDKIINDKKLVFQTQLKRKDGSFIDIHRSAVVVTTAGKKYVHSIHVDISEQKKAETILQESEKRYRDILENMEEGYYEVDVAGNLTFFNTAFSRMYGYPPEELLGMNNRKHMTPETAKRMYKFFNELYSTGKSPSPILDYEVIRKDGSILSAEISVSLIKNPQGKILGFRGIVRDVTEKKKIENQLRENEALYRKLFDHAGFSIILIDARTGERVAYNQKSYEELGYTEEEYLKIHSRDFYPLEADYLSDIKKIFDKGSHTYTTQMKRKDGEVRDFFRSWVKVKMRGKTYIHGIRVDVTDQKRIEQKLRESEARFRTIFEAAADPIFLIDTKNGRILDVNSAACTVLGYSRENLLNMDMAAVADPENTRDIPEFIDRLGKRSPLFYESTHQKKDGSFIFVEVSSCLVEHSGEKAVLSIVRNVTERKHKEAELDTYRQNLEKMVNERTRKLEDAQKELVKQEKLAVLGQLTATVSHELRNPLAVIQSSDYFLQRKVEDKGEKIQKHLKRIEEQVGICDGIVADLLEYTRGKKAWPVKEDVHFWLPGLIRKISLGEGTFIKSRISKSLPLVFHDPVKMGMVMTNLLSNALLAIKDKAQQCRLRNIDYTPEIVVSAKEEKDYIIFEVRDNGLGMDRQTMDQALDPLFTTRARGTGLGLANVEKIIAEHGGQVILNSKPDLGTNVRMTLPNKDAD